MNMRICRAKVKSERCTRVTGMNKELVLCSRHSTEKKSVCGVKRWTRKQEKKHRCFMWWMNSHFSVKAGPETLKLQRRSNPTASWTQHDITPIRKTWTNVLSHHSCFFFLFHHFSFTAIHFSILQFDSINKRHVLPAQHQLGCCGNFN